MVCLHFEIPEEIEYSFGGLQHVQMVMPDLLAIRESEVLERVQILLLTGVTNAGRRIIGVQVCP